MAIESTDRRFAANGSHARPFRTLVEQHVQDLAKSGISKEQALGAGLYSLSDPAVIGQILNWDGPAGGLGACLVFSYFDRDGRAIPEKEYARIKPGTPRSFAGKGGKQSVVKYESPRQKPNRAYFPSEIADAIANPLSALLITEGEKKALKATIEGLPCIGLVGVWGWNKPSQKDEETGKAPKSLIDGLDSISWRGRTVTIAFDSDVNRKIEVEGALKALAKVLAGKGAIVKLLNLPDLPGGEKCGLDDFLVHHGVGTLRMLIENAQPARKPKPEKPKEPSVTACLMQFGEEAELSHHDGKAYATIGRRTVPVMGKEFAQWLQSKYFEAKKVPTQKDALASVVLQLEANAIHGRPKRSIELRVGGGDERIELYLGDDDSAVVVVDRAGWRPLDRPSLLFRRSPGMLPLPRPIQGGCIESLLKPFINVKSDRDWVLLKAWLVSAFRPSGPYSILMIQGEQGSAKTTAANIIKKLVDPNRLESRSVPRDERELMVAAKHSWVLSFDNVSHVPDWLSDAFCKLANHGCFGTRGLHTNDDEHLFAGARPIILNGIEKLARRGDLAERAIDLQLCKPERYRDEKQIWREFETLRPKMLGAILDLVSGAMRALPEVTLEGKFRMADFVTWAVAAEIGAGGSPETFCEAYADNLADANDNILESDPCIAALEQWADQRKGDGWTGDDWTGTAGDLMPALAAIASEDAAKHKDWPKSARAMRARLTRYGPNLRAAGIIVSDPGRANDRKRSRLLQITVRNRPHRPESHEFQDDRRTVADDQGSIADDPAVAEFAEKLAFRTVRTVADGCLQATELGADEQEQPKAPDNVDDCPAWRR